MTGTDGQADELQIKALRGSLQDSDGQRIPTRKSLFSRLP